MTALHRDLSAPQLWQRSLERSRRRRVVAPKLRRQAARRRQASTAMAAAMLAGPAASVASAQGGGSGSGGASIAAESPANRAIAGQASYDGLLQLGDTGPAVAKVQRALELEANGELDLEAGDFDRKTDQAVRGYQGNKGLHVDGIVGPITWGALFGGSGGVGPAANGGGASQSTVPAVGGAQPGTEFAVRSVDQEEARQLGLSDVATDAKSENGGAVVAIDLRLPGGESGDSSGSGTGVAASSRESSSGHSHGSNNGNQSSPSTGAGTSPGSNNGSSGQPDTGSASPPATGSGATSGSCGSRKIIHPLGGKGINTSGWRTSSRPSHAGIDIAAPTGTPIRAAACGVISYLGWASGYGNYVCVKHTSSFTTCYAHLSRFSNKRVGDMVNQGRIIGYVGSTGRSTGPHLHFETRTALWGRDMNPTLFLQGRAFSGTPTVKASAGATGGPDLAPDAQAEQGTALAPSESVEESTESASLATRTETTEAEAGNQPSSAGDEASAALNSGGGDEASAVDENAGVVSQPSPLSGEEGKDEPSTGDGPSETGSAGTEETDSKQDSPSASGHEGASETGSAGTEEANSKQESPASPGGEEEPSETSSSEDAGEEPSAGSGSDGESRSSIDPEDEEDPSSSAVPLAAG
jgi:murein DD-endopeptidase MepM/ murein hydrolase activator NlpD